MDAGNTPSMNCSIFPHATETRRKLGSVGVILRWISRVYFRKISHTERKFVLSIINWTLALSKGRWVGYLASFSFADFDVAFEDCGVAVYEG